MLKMSPQALYEAVRKGFVPAVRIEEESDLTWMH